MRQQWYKNKKESTRLAEAGMSSMVLDSAFSSLTLVGWIDINFFPENLAK